MRFASKYTAQYASSRPHVGVFFFLCARYNTPGTKEAAYFRTIFHSHFPNNNYGNGIEATVPGGPSVACSTAKAIE